MGHFTIQGRGAASNPKNRFHEIEVEREEWVDAEDPRRARASTAIPPARSSPPTTAPTSGSRASVNPYRGCEHGCVYCHKGDTEVLMGDGDPRAIADLSVGDNIYGTGNGRMLGST